MANSRWHARRERFREIMNGPRCVFPASVFDPLSARIAEDIGYEVGMFAGSTASLTVLGAPDYIVLTLSEFAEQAHRICRASPLPIMVDADHGYGNALNVMRTVEELEAAGICGLSIEDTDLPEPFGSAGKAKIRSREEGLGKVKAALAARADDSLVIAGRTSAPAITDMDDAVARVTSYAEAGADAVFLVGIKERGQLDRVAEAVNVPIILGGVPASMLDEDYLSARGVRICLKGHQTIPAAAEAIRRTMQALRDGTPAKDLEGLASGETMDRLTRKADYDAARKDYLG